MRSDKSSAIYGIANVSYLFGQLIRDSLPFSNSSGKLGVEITRPDHCAACGGVEGMKSAGSRNEVSIGGSCETVPGDGTAWLGDVITVGS